MVTARQAIRFRPYQLEAVEAARNHKGPKGALLVMSTGSGKTLTAHALMQDTIKAGGRVLWLANRKELIDQPMSALTTWWPDVDGGIVRAAKDECHHQVVYASKDTLLRPARLKAYLAHGYPDLVIVDEAHLSAAKGFRRVIETVTAKGAKLVGLTATPDRDGGGRLDDMWEIVYSFGILDGITAGALVQPWAAVDLVPGLDLSSVKTSKGDYDDQDLERALLEQHIIEHTVSAIKKRHVFEDLPFRESKRTRSVDGPCIVYTVTVAQAQQTAYALRQAGINARTVWGDMPQREREEAIEAFRAGEIEVLCNASLLTIGTDIPRATYCVLARPSKSWSLFVQVVGRFLRPHEEKDGGYIIDLVGATREHALVSAPVLVAGTDCEESPDGQHHYLEIEGTAEGRCKHCGVTIRCFKAGGSHVHKDAKCVHCGSPQCPESPDQGHHFVPWDGGKRCCIHCAVEIPDPMASMAGREIRYREKIAWKRLNLPAEVYMCDLGRVGIMFMVRYGRRWLPILTDRKESHPLSNRPVDARLARLLTEDVARRATKKKGFYGLQKSDQAMAIACKRAEAIAKKLKLY